MPVIIALIITFSVGLILRIRGVKAPVAWLWSCSIMPAFVLLAEFVLPYMGGGASMWPIALVNGSFVGGIAGGIGVAIATVYRGLKNIGRGLKMLTDS